MRFECILKSLFWPPEIQTFLAYQFCTYLFSQILILFILAGYLIRLFLDQLPKAQLLLRQTCDLCLLLILLSIQFLDICLHLLVLFAQTLDLCLLLILLSIQFLDICLHLLVIFVQTLDL